MITVFSTQGCQPCKQVIRLLEKENVPFQVIDTTGDSEIVNELRKRHRQFPVVRFPDLEEISGFQPALIRAKLQQ